MLIRAKSSALQTAGVEPQLLGWTIVTPLPLRACGMADCDLVAAAQWCLSGRYQLSIKVVLALCYMT